tara:strand:+ start:2929 stop:9447 length:6519 start_codon:yes stop_codon:yes gene_type:complete
MKKYKSPDGTIFTEAEAMKIYGDKFQSLIDSGQLILVTGQEENSGGDEVQEEVQEEVQVNDVDEEVQEQSNVVTYESPDGTIFTEEEARETYGDSFQSLVDEGQLKKKGSSDLSGIGQTESTESITETEQEDGSLDSGQTPTRELSSIEQKYLEPVEESLYETVRIPGGGSYRKKVGVVYNQSLIDELLLEPGIKAALDAGKITPLDIRTAASNDPSNAKVREKVDEFRIKSTEEITEILFNEKLDKPFIYEESAEDDGFVDAVFSNQIDRLSGFNKQDFNGFITEKGYKRDYLKRLEDGNYDSNSTFQSKANETIMLQVLKEKDELRMLTLYLEELQERDLRFQELEWRKNNKGKSASGVNFIPTEFVNPNQLGQYIEQNMPNYVASLQQQREKVEEKYSKMKNNKQNGLWEFAKSYGNSLDDRLNQVTASALDVFGDSAATGVRMAEEYEQMMKDPNLQYGYISGKEVTVGNVNYLVNANGNVFDTDAKAQVTSFLDPASLKTIRDQAKKEGKDGSSFSAQGLAIDTAGVLGSITLDLFLTKGASSGMTIGGKLLTVGGRYSGTSRIVAKSLDKLRNVPVSRGLSSSIIAQTTLGLSQGVESTLKEAKLAGLNDEDAQELATIAGLEMATLYGLTGFISPQTKATELLFGGINRTTLIKEALKRYTKDGTKGFVARFKEAGREIAKNPIKKAKTVGKNVVDYSGEGVKEFVQENVQQAGERFVVNPSLNKIAGEKIMADTISGDEFINTSMLSFAAAFLMPVGGAAVNTSINSLFPSNDIDKLQMLGLLNANQEKTLKLLDSQVSSGLISLKQRNEIATQIDVYAKSINSIPKRFEADVANAIMEPIYEISQLRIENESLNSDALKAENNKKIEEANQKIDSVLTFKRLDIQTQKELLANAKEDLQKENPTKILTDNEIFNYAIQKSDTDSEIVEEKITLEELSKPDTFTHRTMSKDAITNWADGGQVIGKKEDLKDFDSRVPNNPLEAASKKEGINRQSPNFQKGGVYSGKVKPGEFVVVTKGDNKFIPSASFQNRKTFDKSSGISTLKPDSRQLSNFDLYKVNENGELVKQNWNNYKTNKDAISKQSSKKVDDEKFTDSRKKMESNVLDSESTGKSEPKDKSEIEEKSKKKVTPPKTKKEIKEGLDKEGYTPKKGMVTFRVPVISRFFKNLKIDVAADNPIAKVTNRINRTIKQAFTALGNQPISSGSSIEKSRNEQAAVLFKVGKTAQRFNRLFLAAKDNSNLNPEQLQKMSNDISSALEGLAKNSKGKAINLKQFLKSYKYNDNNTNKKRGLSPEFQKVILKLRTDIDKTSQGIIDADAAPSTIKDVIKSNKGTYLNKSYRFYEGNKKGDEYMKTLSAEVLNEARAFLSRDESLIKNAKKYSKETGLKFENELIRLVDAEINDILSEKYTLNSFNNTITRAGNKQGVFKQRKLDSPQLKALLGEITDPIAKYITTMSKTAAILSKAKHYNNVFNSGNGVYLFEKNDTNRTSEMVKIEGTKSPLDGLYTYPDVINSITGSGVTDVRKIVKGIYDPESGGWTKGAYNSLVDGLFSIFVSFPREAKTVLSLSTQLINFGSNVNFAIINGHLPVSLVNGKMSIKSYTTAAKAVIGSLSSKTDEELEEKLAEYYEKGIIGQSVDVRELRDIMREGNDETDLLKRFSQDPVYKTSKFWEKVLFKNLRKKAAKVYQVGDDFWKIMGYEQQLGVNAPLYFDKNLKDLDANELKLVSDRAAEMVKNQYPNYDRIPKAARFFKYLPFAGNFISFQAESYRTAWNTVAGSKNMINDGNRLIKDGEKNKNTDEGKEMIARGKRFRKEGLRKIGNIGAYTMMRDVILYQVASRLGGKVLGGVVPMLSSMIKDDEEDDNKKEKNTIGGLTEDEKAIRNFLPEWQKNSNVIITKASDGTIRLIDASTFDPHQLLQANLNVLLQSKDYADAIKGIIKENTKTFASKDFVFDAISKSLDAYKRTGYDLPLTGGDPNYYEFYKKVLQPVASRALIPGTILQTEDALGVTPVSGRKTKAPDWRKLVGIRATDVDISRQFYFNIQPKQAQQKMKEATLSKKWSALVRQIENKEITIEKARQVYKKLTTTDVSSINERKEAMGKYILKQVEYALRLGVKGDDIANTLKGYGIGLTKADVEALGKGGIVPIPEIPKRYFKKPSKSSVL